VFKRIELIPVNEAQAIRRPDGYIVIHAQSGALIGLVRIKDEEGHYFMGRIMMRRHYRSLATEVFRSALRQRARPA
jgi:hypothetical protein